MEASRPDPVDLAQFTPGESHLDVLKVVGPPLTSAKQADNSCDIYQLYVHGPDSGGKAALAAGEAVVDIFTIGLAEVIFTPAEIATKNSKYPVTFCYGADDKLVSIQADERPAGQVDTAAATSSTKAPGAAP
jgi:hypothetical protein